MPDDISLLLVTFWPDSAYHDVFLVHAYQWAKVMELSSCRLIDLHLEGEDYLGMQLKGFLQECHVCESYATIEHFQQTTGGIRHTGRFDAWKCLASLLGLRIFPDTFYRADPPPSDEGLVSILSQIGDECSSLDPG